MRTKVLHTYDANGGDVSFAIFALGEYWARLFLGTTYVKRVNTATFRSLIDKIIGWRKRWPDDEAATKSAEFEAFSWHVDESVPDGVLVYKQGVGIDSDNPEVRIVNVKFA